MMKKFQSVRNRVGKYLATAMVVASMALMTCMTCFATGEESSVDISSTIRTAFTTMQSDLINYVAIVLPIALTIVGTYFGVKKAIAFFKSTTK